MPARWEYRLVEFPIDPDETQDGLTLRRLLPPVHADGLPSIGAEARERLMPPGWKYSERTVLLVLFKRPA